MRRIAGSCRLWRRRWLDHPNAYSGADTDTHTNPNPHTNPDTDTDAFGPRLGTGSDGGADGDLHG